MKKDFINKTRKEVIPVRIREARISRGMSLNDLAEGIGVTKQAISKYELGALNISSETLFNISQLLDFPIDFFMKPKNTNDENYSKSAVFFRSTRTAKKIQNALIQKIDFVHEIVEYLKKFIDFPPIDILDIDLDNYKGYLEEEDIEEIAIKYREYWNLDKEPIVNLSNLLLKKGFIISTVNLNTMKVDGYSRWINGVPYIILGSDKNCSVRARFSLAHELGHLILHSHLEEDDIKKNHKIIEIEANRFASAFLLPEETFSKDVHSISLDNFVYLKERWKVSIGAMIRRCYDLDIVDENQYTNLNRYLSMKGWRKKEPLDNILEFEKPTMIQEAFDLLIENDVISARELVAKIALNKSEIEELCFLPKGYFDNYIKSVSHPKIRLIK